MSDQNAITAVADALFHAYETLDPIAPPRESIADLELADAYAIQQHQERAFESAGHTVTGRKIGLTSLAMQQQLGVDSPDFGFFTDKLSFDPGQRIPVDRFIAPKVEPELGFRINRDLDAGTTFDEVVAAVESVHRAIEIIDSRVRDWDITLVDTVADNASCGAVIIDPEPLDISIEQLTEVPAIMSIDGTETGRGTGAAVMGHPLRPLEWLANVLGEMNVPLKAGQIILTGSFCAAAPVAAGQKVDVNYGPFGTLHADFI